MYTTNNNQEQYRNLTEVLHNNELMSIKNIDSFTYPDKYIIYEQTLYTNEIEFLIPLDKIHFDLDDNLFHIDRINIDNISALLVNEYKFLYDEINNLTFIPTHDYKTVSTNTFKINYERTRFNKELIVFSIYFQ